MSGSPWPQSEENVWQILEDSSLRELRFVLVTDNSEKPFKEYSEKTGLGNYRIYVSYNSRSFTAILEQSVLRSQQKKT